MSSSLGGERGERADQVGADPEPRVRPRHIRERMRGRLAEEQPHPGRADRPGRGPRRTERVEPRAGLSQVARARQQRRFGERPLLGEGAWWAPGRELRGGPVQPREGPFAVADRLPPGGEDERLGELDVRIGGDRLDLGHAAEPAVDLAELVAVEQHARHGEVGADGLRRPRPAQSRRGRGGVPRDGLCGVELAAFAVQKGEMGGRVEVRQRRCGGSRVDGGEQMLGRRGQLAAPELGRAEVAPHHHGDDVRIGQSEPSQRVLPRAHARTRPPRRRYLPDEPRPGAATRSSITSIRSARRGGRCAAPVRAASASTSTSVATPWTSRAAARPAASSGRSSSTARGTSSSVAPARGRNRAVSAGPGGWPPDRRPAARAGLAAPSTTASSGMSWSRNHSAALRFRSRRRRGGIGRARSRSTISRCSRYHRPARPTAWTNRWAAASSASIASPSVPAGERVGQPRADQVHDADLLQERHELGGLAVEHLAEQVAGDAVVVAGESGDGGLDVVAAAQVQRGQAQPGRPALRPRQQPLELPRRQLHLQPGEQAGHLVGPEREVAGPQLGEQPRQPQPRQRPRRVVPRRGQQRQHRQRPLDEPQQPGVHLR